jgi:G3E family GTPase
LNTDAPKVFVNKDIPVSPELIFGLDTKLFELQGAMGPQNAAFRQEIDNPNGKTTDHHENELDTMEIKCFGDKDGEVMSLKQFESFLGTLDKEDVYRLKGFVRLSGIRDDLDTSASATTRICVVNHAFGKWTVIPVPERGTLTTESGEKTHDPETCTDKSHNHPPSQTTQREGHELQLHFILMGELAALRYKLVHGCGALYSSGEAKFELKSGRARIPWDSPLPATYGDFLAEQMAK